MNETFPRFDHMVRRLESILMDRGVLGVNGGLAAGIEHNLPHDLEIALGNCICTPAELAGLLRIARDARDGRVLSPTVLMAARLMAQEVILALEQTAEKRLIHDQGTSLRCG